MEIWVEKGSHEKAQRGSRGRHTGQGTFHSSTTYHMEALEQGDNGWFFPAKACEGNGDADHGRTEEPDKNDGIQDNGRHGVTPDGVEVLRIGNRVREGCNGVVLMGIDAGQISVVCPSFPGAFVHHTIMAQHKLLIPHPPTL